MKMRRCNADRLLLETPEAYYWLGFILADGHIHNSSRLKVILALKDKDHLEKLAEYLETTVKVGKQVTLTAMHTAVFQTLCLTYSIVSNKTESPPDLSSVEGDSLFALTIGFIDGDGCIDYQTGRSDAKLRVKCHKSWLDTLSYMFGTQAKVNSQGYAEISITNFPVLREMKRRALSLGLPIMERKWDKVDLDRVSRYERSAESKKIALDMLSKGSLNKDICEATGLCASAVSLMISRNNMKPFKKIVGGADE